MTPINAPGRLGTILEQLEALRRIRDEIERRPPSEFTDFVCRQYEARHKELCNQIDRDLEALNEFLPNAQS